jgi:hypothetical protein
MNEYTYDLSSAFVSGSGTIVLPGGGTITIGGGTGYPSGGYATYPYYGQPGGVVGTTSGWMPLILLVLAFLVVLLLAR